MPTSWKPFAKQFKFNLHWDAAWEEACLYDRSSFSLQRSAPRTPFGPWWEQLCNFLKWSTNFFSLSSLERSCNVFNSIGNIYLIKRDLLQFRTGKASKVALAATLSFNYLGLSLSRTHGEAECSVENFQEFVSTFIWTSLWKIAALWPVPYFFYDPSFSCSARVIIPQAAWQAPLSLRGWAGSPMHYPRQPFNATLHYFGGFPN